ncbi:hypothetical protein [Methanobacterium sp. ACI-7]|uniref:hypothetical protein n=1 Tax=unclassified Methanobacterium TaxID=2627676 RepID=UPI0039C2F499
MHFNKLNIIGIFMILFAIFIYATNLLDHLILSITYPFLEGSSEGKSVILFAVMGSMLLFYPLFRKNGFIGEKISNTVPKLSLESQKYLKITIIIIFITYLFGIFLEIWIRTKFGVSLFTIFISYGPDASSTSINHSHVLKSVLGSLVQFIGIGVPSHINTGVSLTQYFSPFAFAIFIAFPLVYLTGLTSLSRRNDLYKIILAFGLTISLIGMLDGGLFSIPALFGLLILLSVYFMKSPFKLKYLKNPFLIVILLIILRLAISLIGTNTEYHEITIINPSDNIDLQGYTVLNIEKEDNKMIVKVPGNTNDKMLLLKLIADLKGKCSGFFLSWNIYSWA